MRWSKLGTVLVATCVVSAALLTGCGSSSKPAVCTDAENLKSSVQALKDVNVRENGVSAVTDQVTKIQQQLQTLHASAKGQFATQINDVNNALNHLKSSAQATQANPSAATIATLTGAVGSVVTAGQNLSSAVSSTC